MIAILTSIYNSFDTLKPILPQSTDVEWICVTDTYWPQPNDPPVTNGWKIVYEPRPHLHSARAAKTPKCLPWLYTSAESSIWIDASYRVTSTNFAEEAIRHADPIAQFKHPWRNCAFDEADEILRIPKHVNEYENVKRAITALSDSGHPDNWGLWATGVIARRHTDDVISAGFDWLSNIYRYSVRDQISHPDVMRRWGLRPINLPGTHLANDWLQYEGSNRHL